jgi:uncharacterized membrane protein YdbT with pleckstrin-like domain
VEKDGCDVLVEQQPKKRNKSHLEREAMLEIIYAIIVGITCLMVRTLDMWRLAIVLVLLSTRLIKASHELTV